MCEARAYTYYYSVDCLICCITRSPPKVGLTLHRHVFTFIRLRQALRAHCVRCARALAVCATSTLTTSRRVDRELGVRIGCAARVSRAHSARYRVTRHSPCNRNADRDSGARERVFDTTAQPAMRVC
jgi:hypothetical protein